MGQVTPKFSPTRSAELLALAEVPIVGGYDMEELCECGSDYGDHSGLECPQGETQFRPARRAIAAELRIAVEVIKRQTPYMRHRNDAEIFCEWLKSSDYPCTCGLSEALSMVGE